MYTGCMYSGFLKKLAFSAFMLVSLAFLSWSLVGPMHIFGMQMDGHNQTSKCVFDGLTGTCMMNPLEHIALWQSLFDVVPVEIVAASLLSLTLVFVVFLGKLRLNDLSRSEFARQKFYVRLRRNSSLFDFLEQVFSQGILNPKLF